jgi:hypothetical protein
MFVTILAVEGLEVRSAWCGVQCTRILVRHMQVMPEGETLPEQVVACPLNTQQTDPGRKTLLPTVECQRAQLLDVCQPLSTLSISVPVFVRVVVIAAREFDEHARLIAHRPRIVTRWQQHDVVL